MPRLGIDGTSADVTWIVDWSDSEHASFLTAWRQANLAPSVHRARPIQTDVGTMSYRVRVWPRYLRLAASALRYRTGSLVYWQAAAGILAALLPRPREQRLVVLNPILDLRARTSKARLGVRALSNADAVVVYSRRARDELRAAGVVGERLTFIPLGTSATPGRNRAENRGYLLAAGRSHRDWATLSAAAQGVPAPVKVLGPSALRKLAGCTVVHDKGKEVFRSVLSHAAALVVPLKDGYRQAGTLAVLEAMAMGVPVIATRGPGTEDYLDARWSRLVAPGDVADLRRAMTELTEPTVSADLGRAARRAALERFPLRGFVESVQAVSVPAHAQGLRRPQETRL